MRRFQVKVPVNDRPTQHRGHSIQQSYRYEFTCSPTSGKVWQERIPISPPPVHRQTYHLEWRIHPLSGETYQVEVPTSHDPNVMSYPDSRHGIRTDVSRNHLGYDASPLVRQNQLTPGTTRNQSLGILNQSSSQQREEIAGISRIDRGNNRRQSRVVDLARSCPVKWAKSSNNSNINLPLYTWGAIAELESSLSGRTRQLPEGELLGKLRHLKSIVEVCCLNSASTDFNSYGWTIAKDYALKVEDEVAQNLISWNEMQHGVRTSSLVLAQMDCPRQHTQKASKGKDSDKDKIVCLTYNKCSTKGKCDYEVTHQDKTCQRKHECSWCRSNLNQGFRHQAWECNKKKEAEGSSSS